MEMTAEKLNKILDKFWKSKGKNPIYHLGRCADFAWALQKFLHGGEMYTIGGNPPKLAWHVVLHWNGYYWDVRGKQDINQVMMHNPIAVNKNSIIKAGPEATQHIISLLNNDFVQDTINGLKKAEKEV